jgi:hypothetical protein
MADALTRMRAICAELPAVQEKPHYGDVVFTTSGRIFASCGRYEVVFQPAESLRDALLGDPRFKPYPRDQRALVMDITDKPDWNLIKQLVFDSYGLHAGAATPSAKPAAAKKPARKLAAKKLAAKKPAAKKPAAKKPAAKKPPTKKPTKKR